MGTFTTSNPIHETGVRLLGFNDDTHSVSGSVPSFFFPLEQDVFFILLKR